jgi:outer membrane protein OmpA-like peptidoglycan-associated protein/tetratricopeptide (TPR) repeat protein
MRQVFILSLLCFVPVISRTQPLDENLLREYFLDAEFFLAEEEYIDALYDYTELYNNGFKDNANINYRIGICYLNIPGQKERSISFFLESIKNLKNNNRDSEFREEKAPMDAYLYLGNAYRVNNMLDKAIEAYNSYKEMLPSSDKAGLDYVNHEIEACHSARQFIDNPVEIRKTNLGKPINGNSSNFKAVISGDGKSLLYMNELPFYDAVYYSVLKDGIWTDPVNITPQLQSDGDQYVTSVSYDGTTLYLTKEDNFNSDIYFSKLKDSIWQAAVPVSNKINTKYWESHASISKDGNTLYLASNRRGGFGGTDIYKSILNEEGEWSKPENLGSVINTSLNEDTPFITEDGKVLYFSSQGHGNMGGYDIFKSTTDESGTWSKPENLGYPVNTTDDDLFYYPWKNGRVAYMSVFEAEGLGKEDIYQIQIITPELVQEEIAEMVEEDAAEEEVTQQIAEVIQETIEEVVEYEETEVEKIPEKTEEILVEEEVVAAVTEEKPDEAEPVEEIREIFLSPVYFGFDRYDLTNESKAKLNKIVSLAGEIPTLTFELIGLTDAIGPASYNKQLSVRRAGAVKNYLLSAGVAQGRIVAIGYGETRFAAINSNPDGSDSPEGRKYNRRVEIEIKGEDPKKLKIERAKVPEHLRIK